MLHVFRHERPEEVKARRILFFVFNPASLFQSFLHIAVATSNNENFRVGIDPISFLPLVHISDVELRLLNVGFVALQEIIECFRVLRCRLGLAW